jgi:hypothetical protein
VTDTYYFVRTYTLSIRAGLRRKEANIRRSQEVNGMRYEFANHLLKHIMLNQHKMLLRTRPLFRTRP